MSFEEMEQVDASISEWVATQDSFEEMEQVDASISEWVATQDESEGAMDQDSQERIYSVEAKDKQQHFLMLENCVPKQQMVYQQITASENLIVNGMTGSNRCEASLRPVPLLPSCQEEEPQPMDSPKHNADEQWISSEIINYFVPKTLSSPLSDDLTEYENGIFSPPTDNLTNDENGIWSSSEDNPLHRITLLELREIHD